MLPIISINKKLPKKDEATNGPIQNHEVNEQTYSQVNTTQKKLRGGEKRIGSKKKLPKGKWWRTFLGKRPPNTPKTLSWHLSPAHFFKHFVSIKIENFPQHNE